MTTLGSQCQHVDNDNDNGGQPMPHADGNDNGQHCADDVDDDGRPIPHADNNNDDRQARPALAPAPVISTRGTPPPSCLHHCQSSPNRLHQCQLSPSVCTIPSCQHQHSQRQRQRHRDWSHEKYNTQRAMPLDRFLFVSCVIVAKDARTALPSRTLLLLLPVVSSLFTRSLGNPSTGSPLALSSYGRSSTTLYSRWQRISVPLGLLSARRRSLRNSTRTSQSLGSGGRKIGLPRLT